MSMREQQKNETRGRVVEAARELFKERGYEAATIRDIAKRAGVAPGSVFTTFESKAELLQEIIFHRYEETLDAVRAAAWPSQSTLERLAAGFRAVYALESRELRLLAETIGASWTWSVHADQENRARIAPLIEIIRGIVEDGVKSGELRPNLDVLLVTDVIFSCYLRNYRRALFDGWTPDQMASLMQAQITLVFQGAQAA